MYALNTGGVNPFMPNFQQSPFCLTLYITKTYLYYFDPLKSHFYKVKLGFTGVYIIFLISAQKQIVGTR